MTTAPPWREPEGGEGHGDRVRFAWEISLHPNARGAVAVPTEWRLNQESSALAPAQAEEIYETTLVENTVVK